MASFLNGKRLTVYGWLAAAAGVGLVLLLSFIILMMLLRCNGPVDHMKRIHTLWARQDDYIRGWVQNETPQMSWDARDEAESSGILTAWGMHDHRQT